MAKLSMTPDKFKETDRDWFLQPKGHVGPALYSTLYLKGFLIKNFCFHSNTMEHIFHLIQIEILTPGVDMNNSSLDKELVLQQG